MYVFFWVIPRRLNFICRRFGTLCLFHIHRQVGVKNTYIFCLSPKVQFGSGIHPGPYVTGVGVLCDGKAAGA